GFERVVLLPLGVSNFFSFDDYAPYRTQFEYLVDILLKTPPHIGLLVTEYIQWGRVLHDEGSAANLQWLRSTFPNFLFHQEFRRFASSSPYLLSHVDGVITVVSNVGPQ